MDVLTLHVAIRALLGMMLSETPVLIAIDDAHWADQASNRALRFAISRAEGRVRIRS